MPADWTQPPLAEAPGNLGPALAGARLVAVESDRAAREARLRFALPPDAGPPEATFVVAEATHLLAFAYLPPFAPLPEGDALASVGDWARQGLVTVLDPSRLPDGLVVERARLHVLEGSATLAVEGHGDDADAVVWWEVRASGKSVSPRCGAKVAAWVDGGS